MCVNILSDQKIRNIGKKIRKAYLNSKIVTYIYRGKDCLNITMYIHPHSNLVCCPKIHATFTSLLVLSVTKKSAISKKNPQDS